MMKRYHPMLVVMHWLLAIMIVIAIFMGTNVLAEIPNSHPEKLFALQMHMIMGMVILVFMVIRLLVRFFTSIPPRADIGNGLLNWLGHVAHYALYILVFGLATSGVGIALLSGLPEIIFGGSGQPLPANFDQYLPRAAHGILSRLLMLLITGHVLAFLYHQFIRKDSLFSRMWFGSRSKT